MKTFLDDFQYNESLIEMLTSNGNKQKASKAKVVKLKIICDYLSFSLPLPKANRFKFKILIISF
jgi:hypothetical protein